MNGEKLTINCFNLHTSNGATACSRAFLFAGQAQLRYKTLKPLNWDIEYDEPSQTELDEYDRYAQYFTYSDPDSQKVTGCVRLCRTDRSMPKRSNWSFMLQDHFGESIGIDFAPYLNDKYLEGSRLCVDPKYPREKRKIVVNALLLSMMMYSAKNSHIGILGLMHPKILTATWGRLGMTPENLGPVIKLSKNENDLAQAHIAWAKPQDVHEASNRMNGINVDLNLI